MKHLFYPDAYVRSVCDIDYATLYRRGYRGIVFDIDNTLVPHGTPVTDETAALFERIRSLGFSAALISNNSAQRVRPFAERLQVPFFNSAKKPRPDAFRRSAALLDVRREQVLFVGDQIFTDVLGANLAGFDCILVRYIGYDEPGPKGKRRAAEAVILSRYVKSRRYNRLMHTGDPK